MGTFDASFSQFPSFPRVLFNTLDPLSQKDYFEAILISLDLYMGVHCFPHKAPLVVSCIGSTCNSKPLRAPLI